MDELRILIARLGWPSTSARWWTMHELADRLGKLASRSETEGALLKLLRSRKLEAEVIEVLIIFWMARSAHGYLPTVELAKSIPKPSLLSDIMMQDLKLMPQAGEADLNLAPKDFEIPDDFKGIQGVDLPRIFRTSLSNLEARTDLPFVRQMAFEWTENRAAYPNAPYQGDPWHFTRPLGDAFVGNLSARAALRAISAYLRTLAVAKRFWKMPSELADERSLLALPIHPSLALLRPQRPSWLPTPTSFDKDAEAAVQALLAHIEAARCGDELIAFNSPVFMSIERCVEVSLVRWSQAVGSKVADDDLAAHLERFWARPQTLTSIAPEPFGTTTVLIPPLLDQLMDGGCKAWPLAGTLDLDRIGYLQHDLYPSRIFLPTLPGKSEALVSPRNAQLEVTVDGQAVADVLYWNAGWGPARPRQFGGNCGTALISRGKTYRNGADVDVEGLRSFYIWRVRTLHRSGSFDKFVETLAGGALFI